MLMLSVQLKCPRANDFPQANALRKSFLALEHIAELRVSEVNKNAPVIYSCF